MSTKNQIALKKEEYLNKPQETIQIEGKLSLLQHKCWNILALHSIKSGLREGKMKYEIPLTLLYKYLQYKGENDTYLEGILVDIMHVVVQGNLINEKGGKDWHAFVLLSRCSIQGGVLHYEYPSFVAELLANPKRYVKMLIKLQNRFNSGYSLKLYEYLKTKYIEKQGRGTTGELEIKTFRYLMGLEEGAWLEFKILKRDIILPAIKEINEKTDLFVELELIKNRQKVVALQFQIIENPNKKQNLKDLDLDLEAFEGLDLDVESNNESNNILKNKLEKLNFGEAQINKFSAEQDRNKVLDCVDYVLMRVEKGATIKDLTAYLNSILEMHREGGLDISAVEDWRSEHSKQENEIQIQKEARGQEDKLEKDQKIIIKLKQEKVVIYKQTNPVEVMEICRDYLEELQQTKQHFILENITKEAKKQEISVIDLLQNYILTKQEVENRIWKKIELNS